MAIFKKIVGPLVLSASLISCGVNLDAIGEADEEDEETTNTSSNPDAPDRTTTAAAVGTLALAFPNVELSSAFMDSDATATLNLAEDGEEISVITEPPSPEQKEALIDESLEAESLEDCFNLAIRAFSQPSCFAPNLKKSEWTSAQSSYEVTFGASVDQLLYGDGGIVAASESSGESCTSSTINYFVEGAIAIVDQGKEVFASLVCASRFYDVDLPNNETTDFMSLLTDVNLPKGITFDSASMSHEVATSGEDIYTTQLQISMKEAGKTQKMLAYFRTQPENASGVSKGHAVVFHAGINDPLQSANSLALNDPIQPAPGQPAPGQPAPGQPAPGQPAPGGQAAGGGQSGSDKIAVVSVSYETSTDSTRANLHRADFVGSYGENHPASFITADGAIDHSAIAKKDSGHGIATNIVDAAFVQSASGTSAGQGIVGWTASYSDSFWRSFAYTVDRDTAGAETAKSTFGFAKSWVSTEEKVYAPTPGLGMFCAWAQANLSNPGSPAPGSPAPVSLTSSTHLEGSGLSGTAQNLVQLQVSSRADATSLFTHSSTDSFLKYEIATDCGSTATVNNLVTVESDGSVTGSFTAPGLSTLSPLGGVSLDTTVDLTID